MHAFHSFSFVDSHDNFCSKSRPYDQSFDLSTSSFYFMKQKMPTYEHEDDLIKVVKSYN